MTDSLLSLDQVGRLIQLQLAGAVEVKQIVTALPKPMKIPFTNTSYWFKSDIEKWIGIRKSS